MMDEDMRIQEAAYYLWESEGQPSGQEMRHWEMAQQMVGADEAVANSPRANELPQQQTLGPVPEEKPRRGTRSKTEPAAKARTSGAKKPKATGVKKTTK